MSQHETETETDAQTRIRTRTPVRVVIVDDSNNIRATLTALLTSHPETEVVGSAADGAAGVAVTLEQRPDVVVMDMQMPIMDGIEASRQILQQWPEATILMNSAFSDESLRTEAGGHGVKSYLSKDQRPSELVAAILTLGNPVGTRSEPPTPSIPG